MTVDPMNRRGFEAERTRAHANLARELAEVRRALEAAEATLTSSSGSETLLSEVRRLAVAGNDAASCAGLLVMAHRLEFLVDGKEV